MMIQQLLLWAVFQFMVSGPQAAQLSRAQDDKPESRDADQEHCKYLLPEECFKDHFKEICPVRCSYDDVVCRKMKPGACLDSQVHAKCPGECDPEICALGTTVACRDLGVEQGVISGCSPKDYECVGERYTGGKYCTSPSTCSCCVPKLTEQLVGALSSPDGACGCIWTPYGCKITSVAPPNHACYCQYHVGWRCTGHVVPCMDPESHWCKHPGLNKESCLQGAGDCLAYLSDQEIKTELEQRWREEDMIDVKMVLEKLGN